NGRTCFTCHQTQTAWSVSAQSVQDRFNASSGNDPIFRLVDGANCPNADVSTLQNKLQAYSLLLSKGLIRIGIPIPANTEFQVSVVNDPYNCNTNPTTGLLSPTSGIVSIYRRPLPSTNLGFLSAVMWDGREPSLLSQSVDATLGHAQANASPSAAQQQQIVNLKMAFLQPNAWMTQRRISMPMGLRAALSHCKHNFPVSTSASMTRSEEIRQMRNLPQISSTFFRPGPTFLERVT